MKYIDYIKLFWRSHDEHSFSTTEIALYFHLLEVCNICRWKNQFKRNNIKIQADLGISYNTLKNARNRLKQSGLIDFQSKNGNANVSYSLSNFDEVANEVTNEVGDEVANEVCTSKERLRQRQRLKEIDKEKTPFENFNERLAEECPLVCKLSKQITEPEFEKLMSKYSKVQIWDIIEQMENYKGLSKKYTSVYKTADNWLKRRENGNSSTA